MLYQASAVADVTTLCAPVPGALSECCRRDRSRLKATRPFKWAQADWLFNLFRHDSFPMGPARSVSKAPYPLRRRGSLLMQLGYAERRGAQACFRMMVIANGAFNMVPIRRRLIRPPSREGTLP